MKSPFALLLTFSCVSSLFADHPPIGDKDGSFQAWFTGPLLTPTSTVIPPGHYNIEPYIFYIKNYSSYTDHWKVQNTRNSTTINAPVYMQIGLFKRFDIQIVPQVFYKEKEERTSANFGDLPIQFDYQLCYPDPNGFRPRMKLSAGFTAPIGSYNKLNPHKLGTSNMGMGSWNPLLAFTMGKVVHIEGIHFFSWRASFIATLPNTVHVRGFNSYGGGYHTAGKVRRGATYTGLFGLEYNFTQNWAIALDLDYSHTNKVTFKGAPGVTSSGAVATVGGPATEQLSVAPAIEYNWNANVGIITGIWFSVIGRNSSDFCSGVVALNVYK